MTDRTPSDRHDPTPLEHRLDGLRFVEPTPVLRRQTLAAVREALDDELGDSPSWMVEALLAGAVLILALTFGPSEVDHLQAPPSRARAGDVMALVDLAGPTVVARHVPRDRPAHAERSASAARLPSLDSSLLDPSSR